MVVEWINQTLKSIMWCCFTSYNTRHYVECLEALVASYNNTFHSSIRTTPQKAAITVDPEHVWTKIYSTILTNKLPKLKREDCVHIESSTLLLERDIFQPGLQKSTLLLIQLLVLQSYVKSNTWLVRF